MAGEQAVLGADSEVVVVTRIATGTSKQGREWAAVTLKAARWAEVPVESIEFRCDPAVAKRLAEGDMVQVALDFHTYNTTRNGFVRTVIDPMIIAAKHVDAAPAAKAA